MRSAELSASATVGVGGFIGGWPGPLRPRLEEGPAFFSEPLSSVPASSSAVGSVLGPWRLAQGQSCLAWEMVFRGRLRRELEIAAATALQDKPAELLHDCAKTRVGCRLTRSGRVEHDTQALGVVEGQSMSSPTTGPFEPRCLAESGERRGRRGQCWVRVRESCAD